MIEIRVTATDPAELQLAEHRLRRAFTDVQVDPPVPDVERPGWWLLTATTRF